MPQGRFKIANKLQAKMSGNTKILVNQDGREIYGDDAAEVATDILQGDNKFFGAEDTFEVACAEESLARARSQRAGNLSRHAKGTANEREEDGAEENAARNLTHPARNPVQQATGEVETIFGGGNGWGNGSAPPLAPHTLGIPKGAAVMIKQQATKLPEGGNEPTVETTAHNLHRALTEGNPTLHNAVVGGNGMGGATGKSAAPIVAPAAGK